MKGREFTSLAMLVLAAAGCMNQTEEPEHLVGFQSSGVDGGSGSTDDDDETLAVLVTGSYRTSAEFTHVSSGPYPSSAVSGAFVDLWVSSEAFSAYSAITPDTTGSGSALPLGAIIVRAVSDASGTVTKLTLMRHGPVGINPTLDDWWFAETDPTGVPLSDDGGPLTGPLASCMTCHLGRASDDYLFGVPTSAR